MGKLKFCANLSFMFTEHADLISRIEAASRAGFKSFEVAFPYDCSIDDLVAAKNKSGMSVELINIHPGKEGELGLAALPGRESDFRDSLQKAITYAKALDCKRIHIMSGKRISTMIVDLAMDDVYFENISHACDVLSKEGITALIEPINNQTIPNYFMNDFSKAVNIIRKIGNGLMLQLDIFHLQHLGGNITHHLKEFLPITGHIQIAQVPDRHEPNTLGELEYRYIFSLLEELKYQHWIGLEYSPIGDTNEGLAWMEEYGYPL